MRVATISYTLAGFIKKSHDEILRMHFTPSYIVKRENDALKI